MKKVLLLMLFLSLFCFVGCEDKPKEEESGNGGNEVTELQGDYKINEKFKFMDFEIIIQDVQEIVTIKKNMSSDDGKKVIKVPILVKNVGSSKDHLSMFYYKLYDSKKKDLASKGSYFNDSIDYADDLKPGESYKKYIYIPYQGSGEYIIEFNNFSNKYKIIVTAK